MKPYWDEMTTSMPSYSIEEMQQHHDNIYIEDGLGRVWQIWFETEGPTFRLIDRA